MEQNTVKALINVWVDEYVNLANHALSKNVTRKDFTVDFKLRGTTAGRGGWYDGKGTLKFNLILASENITTYRQTVAHEVAHMFQRLIWPNSKPHGAEWKTIMDSVFDRPTNRCHTYDTETVKATRKPRQSYNYRCGCRTIALTSIRHGRVVSGKQSYRCTRCKQVLKYVG